MSKVKQLTKRQSALIEDLLTQDLEEQEILEKHHVGRREYDRWLADERFTSRLEQRMAHACRRSRMILARSAAKAAVRLVELTKGENGETARKACLDIIAGTSPRGIASDGSALHAGPNASPTSPSACGLSPETAARLLAALARIQQDVDSPTLGRDDREAPRP